jgi:hypothetical protein
MIQRFIKSAHISKQGGYLPNFFDTLLPFEHFVT